MTLEQLNELKAAHARGILKVREGDTWVEYQSMKDMGIAIDKAEAELSAVRQNPTRLVTTSKGYHNG